MQMKKSLFGFSAKVAMAVLAVCSFVLTSCYEKTPVAKTPSEYYVVGTVYSVDADGNYAKISERTCGFSHDRTFYGVPVPTATE